MRPKIALVLGGGGSRGIAHLGVLEVLVRENIPIDFIVGTSMGSIVGGLFALGHAPADIADGMRQLARNSIIRSLTTRARYRRIHGYLTQYINEQTFADLNIPMVAMAVDMVDGEEVILRDGPLLPALLASSAVPGAFPPVRYRGMQLADGGVIDSVATHVAYQEQVDKIIAVDVYPPLNTKTPWIDPVAAITGVQLPGNILGAGNDDNRIPSTPASIWRSIRIMTYHLHKQRLKNHPPDILLRPSVDNYGSLDFKDVEGPRQAGFDEAERCLTELKSLIQ
ncbi:patatin-like phospholipase family protein [Anaerolineales bacterium HSG24]|nr:patatin-like phospholipase family protein [Anaerolineales bacterium HSG24]